MKQRLRDLPPLSGAVKLNDRVAALTRSIQREEDLYLELEAKEEVDLSTTDSARTVNRASNPRHRIQRNDARARRRERLNSNSSMSSEQQLTPSHRFYSEELSSPEPVTLRETRKGSIERVRHYSSLVESQYGLENNSMLDTMRVNVIDASPDPSIDCGLENDEGAMNNDRNLHRVAKPSISPSFFTADCPFVTRKKTPIKFGGYRPVSGLLFRNLSSDSESDAALDHFAREESKKRFFRCRGAGNLMSCRSEERKLIRDSDFAWSNSYCSASERVTEVAAFPVWKFPSPVSSEESRLSLENQSDPSRRFESSPESQIPEESRWTAIGDTRYSKRDSENLAESNTLINGTRNLLEENKDVSVSDGELEPEVPRLDIESQNHSQLHSPSPESKVETVTSSLNVNALIQALSSVSLKQEELAKRRNESTIQEKSPLGYVNRFSGSSGPRSSEYTPAAGGGSRQSLTSVEVSEVHSIVKPSKVDSKTPERSSLTLKSNERTPEALESVSKKSAPGFEKLSVPVENLRSELDPVRGNSFIPVLAKVNKTNSECLKYQAKVKSTSKLISPRKYPNTNFNEEISKPMTSRTTVSQSSERSQINSCSLKSIPLVGRVEVKKIDGLQRKMDYGTSLSAPLSGRRILEPLNLVPKIAENLLDNSDTKFERRRKTANEKIESSPRTNPGKSFSQKCPNMARIRGKESSNSGSVQHTREPVTRGKKSLDTRRKSSSLEKEVLSGSVRPLKKVLVKRRKSVSEKQDYKLTGHSFRDEQKDSELLKKKSSNISDSINCANFEDCLRSGEAVTLPGRRDVGCGEKSFEDIEVFQRLPKVICASLTRHASFNTQVMDNLNDNNTITTMIKKLKKNVQEGDNQWMKQSKPDKEFQDTCTSECFGFSDDDSRIKYTAKKCDFDKFPSRRSLTSSRTAQFPNPTKIPIKIPLVSPDSNPQTTSEVKQNSCSKTIRVSGKIDSGIAMQNSSTLYERKSAHENADADLDDPQKSSLVQSSSHSRQNIHRSTAETTAPTSIPKFDGISDQEIPGQHLAGTVARLSEIESSGFEEEQGDNSGIEVVSSPDLREMKSLQKCIQGIQPSPLKANELVQLDVEKCSRNFDEASNGTLSNEKTVEARTFASAESASCLTVKEERNAEVIDNEKSQPASEVNGDSGLGICERKSSSSSITRSAKTWIHQDAKSLSSTSKWDVTMVNTVRKSQDRFPFTISESASRKTSKFKVVPDVNLDQLMQEEDAGRIITRSGDQEKSPANTELAMISSSQRDPDPYIEKFASAIADDSLVINWNSETPITKLNCKEEPRTLLPVVKGMARKFSARLQGGKAKMKRQQDPKETRVRILYRNKKCQGESGEGSSSGTSLRRSQLFYNKLFPTSVRESTDGSRGSSAKVVNPKRSYACISASLEETPRKSCDRNDLWIQEFDSDVESSSRINSPEKNSYSIFYTKCKNPGTLERSAALNCCVVGDTKRTANRRRKYFEERDLKSPKTPANSYDDEFRIKEEESDKFHDSSAESGCCCVRICHLFNYSLSEAEIKSAGSRNSRKQRRKKFWNKK